MPMSGPNLWPQTGRVAPLPPPIIHARAGRIKKLRRMNAIEVEDNGTKVCKVRKYLCRKCKQPGHNSRVCKKGSDANDQPDEQQESMEDHMPLPQSQASVHSSQVPPVRASPRPFIRAPAPMTGPFTTPPNVSFQPPARAFTRPPNVYFQSGQKFVNMRDLTK